MNLNTTIWIHRPAAPTITNAGLGPNKPLNHSDESKYSAFSLDVSLVSVLYSIWPPSPDIFTSNGVNSRFILTELRLLKAEVHSSFLKSVNSSHHRVFFCRSGAFCSYHMIIIGALE